MAEENKLIEKVVPSQPVEREEIGRITAEVGVFDQEEVDTVFELFDDYVADPVSNGYYFLSYRDEGRTLGFACYGPTPLTQGTYDLYWICTDRQSHQRGVGKALLRAVEAAIRAENGRLIIISTSSKPDYKAAREFYVRTGCNLDGIIRDYYEPGDDLYLYSRRVE